MQGKPRKERVEQKACSESSSVGCMAADGESHLLYRQHNGSGHRQQTAQRAAPNLLAAWVENGFLLIADLAKKTRTYDLTPVYRIIIDP